MISYRKSFDFTASDDELYDYVEKMIDVMVGKSSLKNKELQKLAKLLSTKY